MIDPQAYTYRRGNYHISTDPSLLDLTTIHHYLTHSYWSPGVPLAVVANALRHSLCFGLYEGTKQIGLARVITDYSSFAYLSDVFILHDYQQQGLGTWLMECVTQCPALAGIRSFLLATRDAHGLYSKVGFAVINNPERWMVIKYVLPWHQPDLAETGPAQQKEKAS
jgi:GNAT superfamily N-acetyltransferase